MHFHRDMLATCDSYGRHVLRATTDDRFIGSAPLAFTFGLGGHVLFPLRVGAATIQLEKATPDELLAAIGKYRATICFTAPTAYRAMLGKLGEHDISSLRKCVSAGEALPKATFDAWHKATGIKILDGIGATEMMHIFIGSPEEDIRPGATGRVGARLSRRKSSTTTAATCRPDMSAVSPCAARPAAAISPTTASANMCRTAGTSPAIPTCMDADGYFWYQARSDDMIISAGYNIAGPEVEAALLTHPAVLECGVVGAPDEERGQIVKAYVVLRPGHCGDAATTQAAAGPCQGDDRAVQVSARDRIRHRIAAHADRKAAALRVAPSRGRFDAQTRILRRMTVTEPLVRKAARGAPHKALLPAGWPRPKGYANGIKARGDAVYIGGMVGWDVHGRFPPGFVAQAHQALTNIAAVLAEGGGAPGHIVRMTWYVVDMDEYFAERAALGSVYRTVMGEHYPAMALVEVRRLVESEARLEIEATAVIPD